MSRKPSKKSSSLRPPRQARSRDSLERILTTTELLLKERRFDQITIAEIVREAETSVGVFYSRFANKEALLEFVEERVYQEVDTAIAGTLLGAGPASPAELVHQVVELAVCVHKKFSGISREIVHNAWGDPARLSRGVQWSDGLAKSLRPLLRLAVNSKLHADRDRAADFALLLLLGGVREMIPGRFWSHKMRPTQKQVIEELSSAVLRYLQG